ncbi:hypothetical protein SLEP1_g32867 [Rubroshorea leprosula]|uniref:Uncharacterized protein n=1 Tax=Rubroshorea leprosula TaxID=152421 RepID=A0AAV5KEW0_9ROSI|nr:hypothetical protein SLEP1_g32867 [Rubroshorea leprosula]
MGEYSTKKEKAKPTYAGNGDKKKADKKKKPEEKNEGKKAAGEKKEKHGGKRGKRGIFVGFVGVKL